MSKKFRTLFTYIILGLIFTTHLCAKDNIVPMIKTSFAVHGATWNNNGINFAYFEENNIVVRTADEFFPLQTIVCNYGNIAFMQFTQGLLENAKDQLVTLTDQNVIDIRVLPEPAPIETITLDYMKNPTALAVSSRGTYIAAGSEDGTVTLVTQDLETGTFTTQELEKSWGEVKSMYISRDEKFLAVTDSYDHIKVWNLATVELQTEFDFFGHGNVPAIISHNSDFIFAATGPKSLGVYNMKHQLLHEIDTVYDILNITITYDDENIILLTEDNIFTYYDYETKEKTYSIPSFNANPISTFAFNNTTTSMVIAHTDGSLYILSVDEVRLRPGENPPNYFMVAADDSETLKNLLNIDIDALLQVGNGDGHGNMFLGRRGRDAVEFSAIGSTVLKPFGFDLGFGVFYKNYTLLPPFYFGGGIEPHFGLPVKFPYIYEDSNGVLKNPIILRGKVEVPLGLLIYPFPINMPVFIEACVGINVLTLWNQCIGDMAIMLKPKASFCADLRVGFEYKNLQFGVVTSYDTILNFSVGFTVGFNLNLPIIESRENTLDEKI